MVNLDIAAEMIGHDCTVNRIIENIKEGALTAYARIFCHSSERSTLHDSDDHESYDDSYEIARIVSLKETQSQSSEFTEWFSIQYEPIEPIDTVEKSELESKGYDVLQAKDNFFDPVKRDNTTRVFGCLKSRTKYTNIISTEQICLLKWDIMRFLSGDRGAVKPAAQILAETRHNTAGRDLYVDGIMKRINEEIKKAPSDCTVINHLRFIKEADVPQSLNKSVTSKVRLLIREYFNECYFPLSRAPKKKELEAYFLLK